MTQKNHGPYLCFDPRDPAQSIEDRATWKRSDNAILVASTMLFATHGDQFPIDWDKVSALATLCEDISEDAPRAMTASLTPVHRLATLDETNALLRASLANASRASRKAHRPTTAP
jgi:hypothetical protein